MVYDPRTITHGTQEVTYSKADGATGVSYATGITKFAPSVDQDTKDIYADAQLHMTLLNAKKLTIETTQYQVSDTEKIQAGYLKVNGGFTDNGIYPNFDVQRILIVQDEDGNQVKKLEVYYSCVGASFTESDDEDDDAVSPKEYSRKITVKGRTFDGFGTFKVFEIERTEANAAVFDTYKSKILTPSDFATQG